jgi:putative nucleotide binding protein
MKEETCIILDFLATGYPDRRKTEPIAQAIGTGFFSLLEVVPRENIKLQSEDEAYIGDGKRDKIRFIRGQIGYNDLTNMARDVLQETIEKLVRRNESKFVEFFNKATIITPRMHQFELLPGIGKKHVSDLIEERRKKPFENFGDIETRVKLVPDLVKTLVKRVISELKGEEKYYIFTPRPRGDYY